MARKKFLRSGYHRYSKLGLRRKKKLIYRKAKGGENKVRLNRAGRIVKVKVGFGKKKELRGLVRGGLRPILIRDVEDLKKIDKNSIGIVARVGDKKRKLIAEFALKNKVPLKNINAEKFLKSLEEKISASKEKRKLIFEKRKHSEKKATEKKSEEKKKDNEKKEPQLEERMQETKEEAVKNNESPVKESTEEKK